MFAVRRACSQFGKHARLVQAATTAGLVQAATTAGQLQAATTAGLVPPSGH